MISNKQLFIKFLKENNAYGQFMFNLKHRDEIHKWYPKISAKKYFDTAYEKYLLICAFSWRNTNEKQCFWEELNQKWIDYITTRET